MLRRPAPAQEEVPGQDPVGGSAGTLWADALCHAPLFGGEIGQHHTASKLPSLGGSGKPGLNVANASGGEGTLHEIFLPCFNY